MNKQLLRKISVLILSLSMVMTSMNLSFAAEGVAEDSKGTPTSEDVVNPGEGEVTPTDPTTQSEEKSTDGVDVKKIGEESSKVVDRNGATEVTKTYTGKSQKLVDNVKTYSSLKSNATRTAYRLGESGEWFAQYYSSKITFDTKVDDNIVGTNAGEYKIYTITQKNEGSLMAPNWTNQGSAELALIVTISPATIDSDSLELNETEIKWTGSPITATVKSVTASKGTLKLTSSDYDITGNTGTNEDKYTLTITGKGNYTGSATADWFIVGKTPTQVSVTEKKGLVYNKQDQELIDAASVTKGDGTIKYKLTKGENTLVDWTDNKSAIKTTDAGDYTIEYKVDETTDYAATSGSLTVNIAQAEINSVTLKSNSFTYNAQEQSPEITAVKTKNNLTLTGSDYSVSGNTGTDADNYTVTVAPAEGNTNLKGSATAKWTIAKAKATATLDKTSLEYNGTEQTVTPIVKVGDTTLTQGVDYTVSGEYSATHANTDSILDQNTVTITLKGDNVEFDKILYKDTETLNWKITPKNLTLSWKEEHVTYDKKEHAPELVMDGLCDADKERVTLGSVVWDTNPTALPVNAGTHLMSVTLKFNDSLTGPKFENDYNIKGKNNTVIQGYNKLTNTFFDYFYIDQRAISVLWKDGESVKTTSFEYTFNDTKQMPYAYANPEDICEGDDVPTFNVSVTKASPNASETGLSYNGEVGSYEATASVDSDVWDKLRGKDNYKIADDAQYVQSFKINQAVFKLAKDNDNKYAITFGKNPDYDGNPHTAEVLTLTTVDGIPFDYSKYNENFEFNSTASDAATQTNAGRYNYQLDVKSGNRNFAGSADGEWAIQTDDFSTWTNISATDVIYSAENQAPVVTVKKQADSDPVIQGTDYDVYFIKPDAELTEVFSKNKEGNGYTINQDTILKDEGTAVVDAKEAGTYKLLVWGKGNEGSGNYVGGAIIDWKIVPATISKFDFTIDGESTESVGYNTLEHKVVVTKVYALTNKDKDGKDVYIEVPASDYVVTGDTEATNVNPENYTVTVSAKDGSNNFAGTTSDTWGITAEPLSKGDLSLILNDQNPLLKNLIDYYIYDGSKKSVSTVVKHYINNHEMTLNMADPEKPEQLAEYEIVTEESTMSESGAGTYKVVVKGVNNYTGTAEATWVIRGIKTDWLIARLTETHYTYDGTEHVPDVKVGLLDSLGLPGLVEHEDYEYTIKNSKGEVVRDKDGNFSEDVKSINADTYTVSIKGLKYFQDTKELTYVIEPAEIQKDWILTGDATETLLTNLRKLNGKNYDEPGKYESETGPEGIVRLGLTELTDVQQAIYVKPDSEVITLPEEIKYLEEGVDYEISDDSTTSAREPKSYRVTINGLGNYEGSSVNVYWSIGTGALVWIKDDLGIPHLLRDYDYSREYDGKEFDISERIVLTKYSDNPLSLLTDNIFNNGVVIPKEDYDITGDFKKKDAGTYNFEIIGNGTDGFYQSFEGSWEITPRIVLGRWENTTVEYNGEVQRPVLKFYHIKSTSQLIEDMKDKSLEEIIKALIEKGTDTILDENGILEDYDATAKAVSLTKPKNVGTYQMFSIPTGDFDKNNYKFYDERILLVENIGIWYTPFEITKKTIGIDWSNLEFTYDGDYHVARATATGLCGDDVCLLGVTGRQKDAGTWTAKVEGIVWDSKLLGDNYKLPEEGLEHDFVIKERAISEGKFRTVSTTYNGKEQAPEIIGYDTTGFFNNKLLVEGTDYRVKEIKPITETILVNATDAGKYEVVLEGIGNYTGTTTVEWTINKATPTCTVTPIPGLVYNATAQALVKGELNGTAADSDCSIEYCVKDSVIGVLTGLDDWKADAKGTDAGTYLVYYKINGDRNHNDVGPSLLMVKTSTISKATLTADMITLDPATLEYNGTSQGPTVVVKFADETVVPAKDYHIMSALSDEKAVNVGTYHIYVSADLFTSGNFKDEGLVLDKTWKITAKPITITIEDKTKIYGSEDPEFTFSDSEPAQIVGTDDIKASYTREPGEDVGAYAINATSANKNYSVTFVPGTLTITQKPIGVTLDNMTKIYGEMDEAITWSVNKSQLVGDDTEEDLAVVATREAGENVGEYAISATSTSKNYEVSFNDDATYEITKRPIKFMWTLDGKNINKVTFNGKAHYAVASIGEMGLAKNDKIDDTDKIRVVTSNGDQTNVGKYVAKARLELIPQEEESTKGQVTRLTATEEETEETSILDNYEVSNDTFSFEIVAEPVEDVPTGDDNNMIPYLVMTLLSLMGMAVVASKRRKED